MKPESYGDGYAELFDFAFGETAPDEQITCLANLAGGGRVLELGVGTGRVAIPLAARGLEVHGVDSSAVILDKLAAKPGGEAVRTTISGVRTGRAVAALATGLLLLLVTLPNLGPTVRAARGDGTRGTFTAEELHCVQHPGHEQCSWSGTFRVTGGATRDGYELYGAGRGDLHKGEAAAAIDVGRSGRVYPPSGSREWMLMGGLIAIGLALVAVGGRGLLAARRKAYAGSSTSSSGAPSPT